MNKKAKIFLIGVVLIFVTYVMGRLYITSQNKINKFEALIGEEQLKILDTYKRTEKFLFYVDESAELALKDTINNIEQASFFDEECQTLSSHPDYPIINYGCNNNLKKIAEKKFTDHMNEYLDNFPEEVPDLTYGVYLFEDSIVGKTSLVKIDVRSDDIYNFDIDEVDYVEKEVTPAQDDDQNNQNNNQNNQPQQPQQPIKSSGKCGFIADFAKKYIGCPYSLTEVYILTPQTCWNGGLTCATFVGSVITYTLGQANYPYGHGREKCSNGAVYQLGVDPRVLQPGDIFATEYQRRDGSYTAWGHTGMYVGRGYVVPSSYGGPFCYKQYVPDANGDYIFIHSYGWANMGQPGVCYDNFQNLFVGTQLKLTNFCRPRVCA